MSVEKTWTDIVYDILKEKNKPIHYQDITKEAVKRKETKGKTPENTIVTLLLYEIKGREGGRVKDKEKIKGGCFKALGEGYYSLIEWEEEEAEKALKVKESESEFDPIDTMKTIVSSALLY